VRAARSPRKGTHFEDEARGSVVGSSASASVWHAFTFGRFKLFPAWQLCLRDEIPIQLRTRGRRRRKDLGSISSKFGRGRRKGELAATLFDNVANDRIERAAYDDVGTLWISPKEIGV
jgi:hypothetical protein